VVKEREESRNEEKVMKDLNVKDWISGLTLWVTAKMGNTGPETRQMLFRVRTGTWIQTITNRS